MSPVVLAPMTMALVDIVRNCAIDRARDTTRSGDAERSFGGLLDQALAQCDGYRMCAVGSAKLVVKALEMLFHRVFRDRKGRRNHLVALALGELGQDLD